MIRSVLVTLLGLVFASCATRNEHWLETDAPSPDFAIELRVDAPNAPAPNWFLVEPDSVLRAGAAREGLGVPLRVRQLTPAQRDGLWRVVRDSGLLDPDHPARVGGGPHGELPPGASVCRVLVRFGGYTQRLAIAMRPEGPGAPEAEHLIEVFRGLAWAG